MKNEIIKHKDIPKHLRKTVKAFREELRKQQWYPTLEQIGNVVIKRRLRDFEGHRAATAKSLGISERQLYYKIKELGL